jgi:hypothetical protein
MWLAQYLLNGNYGSLKDAFGHLEKCIDSRNTTCHFPTRGEIDGGRGSMPVACPGPQGALPNVIAIRMFRLG